MTNLTLKNLPPGLYELLKKRAQANRRSLNNEIIVMLEQGLGMREEFSSSVQDVAANYVTKPAENKEKYPLRGMPVVYHEPAEGVTEITLLSEDVLAKDWNRPEEDEAWAHLQPGK